QLHDQDARRFPPARQGVLVGVGDAGDPHRAAHHAAVGDDLVHDEAGQVRGHGEADPLVAAGLRVDGGVDADELAAGVDEGPAGVAGIDGGGGVDDILVVDESG